MSSLGTRIIYIRLLGRDSSVSIGKIVSLNPTEGMNVCIMCVYSVFVLFYV
jgi:hypothetical protein